MTAFEPSRYQRAIFDFVRNGRGDGIINAVAGAGKTTVLVEAAKLIHGDALFCAFNKHIADELSQRLAGTTMTVKTIHSVGNSAVYAALGRTKLDGQKYTKLCKEWVERELADDLRFAPDAKSQIRERARHLEKLVNFARLTLSPTDSAAIAQLADRCGIPEVDPRLLPAVPIILDRGLTLAQYGPKLIDFTDMLWLPIALNLPLATYAWIFVDEAQDLNAAQQAIVFRSRAPGGRMLFVGDERQSIMGFSGADYASYQNIKTVTGATELPLSICYRCPKSHIALAQEIVPAIEASPAALEGEVESVVEDQLGQLVREGDLIICRVTAPLIGWCIKLIQRRIPARVRGRDVAKDLCNLAEKIAELGPWNEFLTYLRAWEQQQIRFLVQKEASEEQIVALQDKCLALETCYESFGAPSVEALRREIEGLFADDRASVWLSTVHRAKGLEADRVFILKPEKLPLCWKGQRPEEFLQEENLRYVALTRAKRALFFLEEQPQLHMMGEANHESIQQAVD